MLTALLITALIGAGIFTAAQFGAAAKIDSDFDAEMRLTRYTEDMHDCDTTPASAPPTLRSSYEGQEFGEG